MSETPLFSIITLTYNSEKTILRTIDSLLNQQFSDFEVIFQDANSNDSTVALINKHLTKFDRACLYSESDLGIYDGLNKALRRTNGKLVCVLHSDDVFVTEHTLAFVAKKFNKYDFDIAYGDVFYSSKGNPGSLVRNWIAGDFSQWKFFFGWMPPHTSLFIKRGFLTKDKVYRTDLKISADLDLILRLFKIEKINIFYLRKPIVNMQIGGMSTNGLPALFKKLSEDYLVFYKYFGVFAILPVIFKRLSKVQQFFFISKL